MAADRISHPEAANPYAAPRLQNIDDSQQHSGAGLFGAAVAFMIVTPIAGGVALMILSAVTALIAAVVDDLTINKVLAVAALPCAVVIGILIGVRTARQSVLTDAVSGEQNPHPDVAD